MAAEHNAKDARSGEIAREIAAASLAGSVVADESPESRDLAAAAAAALTTAPAGSLADDKEPESIDSDGDSFTLADSLALAEFIASARIDSRIEKGRRSLFSPAPADVVAGTDYEDPDAIDSDGDSSAAVLAEDPTVIACEDPDSINSYLAAAAASSIAADEDPDYLIIDSSSLVAAAPAGSVADDEGSDLDGDASTATVLVYYPAVINPDSYLIAGVLAPALGGSVADDEGSDLDGDASTATIPVDYYTGDYEDPAQIGNTTEDSSTGITGSSTGVASTGSSIGTAPADSDLIDTTITHPYIVAIPSLDASIYEISGQLFDNSVVMEIKYESTGIYEISDQLPRIFFTRREAERKDNETERKDNKEQKGGGRSR